MVATITFRLRAGRTAFLLHIKAFSAMATVFPPRASLRFDNTDSYFFSQCTAMHATWQGWRTSQCAACRCDGAETNDRSDTTRLHCLPILPYDENKRSA